MKTKGKDKRGISLIVLVITIIIMIILAATVILSLNSSNVVSKATEAREKSDIANARNLVAMSKAEWELMSETERATHSHSFSNYAKTKLQGAGYTVENTAGAYEVTDKGEVNIYPKIPDGFKASIYAGENTVAGGLVIYEKNSELVLDAGTSTTNRDAARTTYNQFVWVPVGDMNEFVRRDFGSGATGNTFINYCTEPFSRTYTGVTPNVTLSLINDLTGEYAEYNAMRESVAKHGGFYIGRYEAATTTARTNSTTTTTDLLIQKGKPVYNYVGWGPSMISTEGDVTFFSGEVRGIGAVQLSRQLYAGSSSVVSHLTYGVEWDTALNFISKRDSEYLINTSDKGNFQGSLRNTGYYAVNNIYDMAGNVYEWTMEAYSSSDRMFRGGYYYSNNPASYRSTINTKFSSGISVGFRVSLYIK